jgi:light-harvesting complex I chlorophyll a/b binding protein 1
MAATMTSMRLTTMAQAKPEARRNVAAKATMKGAQGMTAKDFAATLPGITAPFPDMFDPAGFLKTASVQDVRRWREAELTHGRVSMLAALGFVIGEQLEDFPAFVNFDGAISGPAIYHFQQVQEVRAGFWETLVVVIGLAESYRVSVGWERPGAGSLNNLLPDYEMGNLYFDPLNMLPEDPEEKLAMQNRELNNGRLAMVSIAGFVAQELVEQTEIFQHLARRLELEIIEELDDIEAELGLPITKVPEIVLQELNIN